MGISQSKAAYQLFTSKGKAVNYDKLLTKALKVDFICFGELHNNPIAHWLELEMAKDLYASKTKILVLGVEMIESDNQTALDSFLVGTMDDMTFDSSVRLWPNYATDYEPLVLWAKENQVHVIASNIPRRYASMVYKKGLIALDSLQDYEKKWMMPLPIEIDYNLKIYKEMMEMMPDHQSPNFPAAQAVKDATMAWNSVARLNAQSRIF
ncbi:MAG: ChaN family lipoprotein, partial [Saprospiraceae bacterium]